MGYKLKVLSPLHIGCGEAYGGLNYLLDKRKKPEHLMVLKEDDIFNSLNSQQLYQLISYIEKEKSPNLFLFLKRVLDDKGFSVQNRIQKKSIYSMSNYSDIYLKEIISFIKENNMVYIPATSIKGTIRTSLIYSTLIDDATIYAGLASGIESLKGKKELHKEMKSIETCLQERVFYAKKGDAKYDLLKYLYIGDSELKRPEEVLSVAYAKPVNASKSFQLFYEYVKPGSEFAMSALELEEERSRNLKLQKMDFSDRQRELVSSMDVLLNCCYRFSKDLLDEEIDYFTKRVSDPDLVNHLKTIANHNRPDAPVIRIGKDEGYLSMTAALAVKKKSPDLYEKILIHAVKGKSYEGKNLLPKTRKVVHYNGKKLTSGWVQLFNSVREQGDNGVMEKGMLGHKGKVDLSVLAKKFNVRR